MTLSDLQRPILEEFVSAGVNASLSIEEVGRFDQRGFRSMIYRSEKRPDPWVAFRPGRGFHLTSHGRDAWDSYHSRKYLRNDPLGPLTSYFDPVAYGIKPPKQKPATRAKLHVVHHRSGAA